MVKAILRTSYFLMWPHRELGYSHSWSPLSWYQWLLDSLQMLGGCLKDFSHIAIDVRSLFPRQASQSRQRAGGEQKTVWKRERLAPLSQNQNFFLLKLSPRYFDGRVVDCSQMGHWGEIDTINHQQTWQWGFTVHPVNKSLVSRVSLFLTNVYIPLLPRYST